MLPTIRLMDVVDILLVALVIYAIIIMIQTTGASRIAKSVLIILALTLVTQILNMYLMNYLLDKILEIGLIVLVVVFQPEIRRALEHVGRNKFFSMVAGSEVQDYSREIEEIERAVLDMSKHKVGALIVFENKTGLNDVIESGHVVDARITSELLENIFFHNAPLHDGAMIIKGNRIVAAGCFLPLSDNRNLSSELGTRHRAALGISEISDAQVLVVSEETGVISLAHEGTLTRYLDIKALHELLEGIYHVRERSSKRIGGKVWNKNG